MFSIIIAALFLSSSVSAQSFTNAKFTFYQPAVGTGSCGDVSSNDSPTVALNEAQYNEIGDPCNMAISITYNGKTVDATIKDKCPGCPHGGLDLSEGLFGQLENLDVGVIYGEWAFKDGSGTAPSQSNPGQVPQQTESAPGGVPPQPTDSVPGAPPQPNPSESTPGQVPPPPAQTDSNTCTCAT